jgi:hypothetical protein
MSTQWPASPHGPSGPPYVQSRRWRSFTAHQPRSSHHRATLKKRLATLEPSKDCICCHEGRATRSLFPTRARGEAVESPALKPLYVIVTDTTGPITPSVASRKAYLQIAQERATNLLAAIPLAACTDIPAALRNLIASWQLTRGTITKRHYTDNAKEQISAAIRTYLHAQGASTTTTCHTLRPKTAPPIARFAQS